MGCLLGSGGVSNADSAELELETTPVLIESSESVVRIDFMPVSKSGGI